MSDPLAVLLRAGLATRIVADNAEAGIARLQALAGEELPAAALFAAVARAVREGLIFDPVVLPEGQLQCHWRLALTEAGVARARALLQAP